MHPRSPWRPRWPAALLLGAALQLFACNSPKPFDELEDDPVSPAGPLDAKPWVPPKPKPWTDEFHRRAALLANRVQIEGPSGLLEHVAAIVDSRVHSNKVRTTSDGLLQEVRVLTPDSDPIGAQLDGWQIMALQELTILERIDGSDVVIVASGDAFWKDPATGEEKREPVLRFTATIEK